MYVYKLDSLITTLMAIFYIKAQQFIFFICKAE